MRYHHAMPKGTSFGIFSESLLPHTSIAYGLIDAWAIRVPGLQNGRLQRSTVPSSLPTPVRLDSSCWGRGQLLDNHEGVQQHPKILCPFSSRNIILLLGRPRPLCTPSINKASDCNSSLATKSLCWHCFHLTSFKTLKQISHLQASQASPLFIIPSYSFWD